MNSVLLWCGYLPRGRWTLANQRWRCGGGPARIQQHERTDSSRYCSHDRCPSLQCSRLELVSSSSPRTCSNLSSSFEYLQLCFFRVLNVHVPRCPPRGDCEGMRILKWENLRGGITGPSSTAESDLGEESGVGRSTLQKNKNYDKNLCCANQPKRKTEEVSICSEQTLRNFILVFIRSRNALNGTRVILLTCVP